MKTQTDHRRPQPKPGEPKKAPRLRVVQLEERIAPRRGPCDDDWGCGTNHNQTVVRDTQAKPAAAPRKKAARLRAVNLEPRITPGTSYQHNETLVREPAGTRPKAPKTRKGRLRAVRLEGRIAPGVSLNHNETLVREPAAAKAEAAPAARKDTPRPKLQVVKLEERVAPRANGCEDWGCGTNHNETLVREPAGTKPKAKKSRPRVVRLEGRIAPGVSLNHNETLVREPAAARPPAPAKDPPKPKLQIVKLEERIAPRRGPCDDEWGCGSNHNETLVRDRA